MHILITGGAGFVGSNLAIFLKSNYKSYTVTVLDNLKRRGSELNIPRLKILGINFLHGDIRNPEDFEQIEGAVDFIIEASAEPSVLAGINSSPRYLVNTNLNGTINCLYFAKEKGAKVIFLSTSRIYPVEALNSINFETTGTRYTIAEQQELPGVSLRGIAEQFPLEGYRTLYGTTKLASELMLTEFARFYNVNYIVNRCGVLTGPWQMGKIDQGVAVLWMAAHFWKRTLSYVGFEGTGKQVRDFLHVADLCGLINEQLHSFEKFSAKTLNVGGGIQNSVSLKELTAICEEITGNVIEINADKQQREGDITMYISDNTKLNGITDWKPKYNVRQTMLEIYEWIRDNENQLKTIL